MIIAEKISSPYSMKKTCKSKKRLGIIRDWRTWIVKPKSVSQETCVVSKTTDPAIETSTKENNTNRRAQDTVHSSHLKRKLNLDRRADSNERRVSSTRNYNGPIRRYTVDRRLNLHDRRSKD